MTIPRVRFTVRRLMITVGVVGVLLGAVVIARLSADYRERSDWHFFMSEALRHAHVDPPGHKERIIYHEAMRSKYDRAARYPWLPVAPDPPEPE